MTRLPDWGVIVAGQYHRRDPMPSKMHRTDLDQNLHCCDKGIVATAYDDHIGTVGSAGSRHLVDASV